MTKKSFYNENGQSMVEYALIIALLVVIAISGYKLFNQNIKALFNGSSTASNTLGSQAVATNSK